jgi:DNA-binding transcriptional LysR family regulator
LRHLRYFLVLSEELHFRRAAERLHIAQPPLSQAIQKLEQELGVVLLERTSRSVGLTDAGRVFAAEARKVLADVHHAIAEARRAGGAGSDVRVGFTPYLPIAQLLPFLTRLSASDPSTRPEVIHLSTVELVRRLLDGELEFAVFPRITNSAALEMEALFPGEPLVAYVASDHRLASEPFVRPADVQDETLLAVPRSENPDLADWMQVELEEAEYRFGNVVELGGPDLRDRILAAASGVGVALLPASVAASGEAGKLAVARPLDPPLSMPETVVAWRANVPGHLAPVIDAARSLARELRVERV